MAEETLFFETRLLCERGSLQRKFYRCHFPSCEEPSAVTCHSAMVSEVLLPRGSLRSETAGFLSPGLNAVLGKQVLERHLTRNLMTKSLLGDYRDTKFFPGNNLHGFNTLSVHSPLRLWSIQRVPLLCFHEVLLYYRVTEVCCSL